MKLVSENTKRKLLLALGFGILISLKLLAQEQNTTPTGALSAKIGVKGGINLSNLYSTDGGYISYLASANIKDVNKDGTIKDVSDLNEDDFNRIDAGLVGGLGIDIYCSATLFLFSTRFCGFKRNEESCSFVDP